ncbi:MAG: chemotaxis protein CheA [Rhodobacterales bacterium]|nr:chemotaxis protein CheA [Rhodobacterales bacterium]
MSEENDPMAEIRSSFFIECEELLEALQDALAEIDDGNEDPESINVVFRAVHSIKGGAGAFGLEPLVRFAHRYETALDEVRSGRLVPDADATRLFFSAADHLSDLVRVCRDDEEVPTEKSDELLAQLDALLGDVVEEEEAEVADFEPLGVSMSLDLPDIGSAGNGATSLNLSPMDGPEKSLFHIRFKPDFGVFETGNEPNLLLRNLAELGIADISCDMGDLPLLAELAPETPYLAWNVVLEADIDESEIREVFEFVDGLCELSISSNSAQKNATDLTPISPPEMEIPSAPNAIVAENTSPVKTEEPAVSKMTPAAKEPTNTAAKSAPTPSTKPAEATAKQTKSKTPKSVVRVDLDRIERLVNLVGELVINQAMLSQSLEKVGLSPHSDAMSGMDEFQRLTRDIQDSVMMIRAQPVKSLFQRMSRIVREASSAVKKDVKLITIGETTEIDKTVIERLADPLTHMIRNAVDHGLENSEDRIAAGKSSQGSVTLSAAHRSGRVEIEVSDDGAGINRPRVLQIAIEKGLIAADSVLSDSETDNLLFLPGFSTNAEVTDLSGRGVGMDVVRTAIQALSGRINITSKKGVGTKFSISLPLTLAVLDGMVVEVANETLVLPLNVVVETLSLTDNNVEMIAPGQNVVRVRDGFVPLFDLGVELGYRDTALNVAGSIVLLIALEDGNRAALIIDKIQDQRQVVIKGLDDRYSRAPGIAAATILGDGQIALILDPTDIIANATETPTGSTLPTERKVGT